MPAAALIIGVIAIETGVALAIGTAVAGVVGATVSVGVATAIGSGVISAGLTAAQGGSVSDVLKSAVIGGVTSYVGASVAESVTTSITSAATKAGYTSIAGSIGKVAGAMAGGGTQSATGALLTGRDPIEALIKGGLTAGLTAGVLEGVNFATSKIPGFSDLGKDYGKVGTATQRAITAGLAAGVMGRDVDKAVLTSALGSVLRTGSDYIKAGIKDLSSSLQTAYNDATTTGKSLEDNITRQEEIVTSYNTASEAFNKQHNALKADYDQYVANKDGYDNYDAKMQREGFTLVGGEDSNYYAKPVGARYEMRDDGEGGQYRALVPDGSIMDIEGNPTYHWQSAPTQNDFLTAANSYAEKVNAALPAYEKLASDAEKTLAGLSTELDGLKTALPALEKTFTDQKTALDTAVTDFQKQEEANAQFITNLVKDTTDAKTSVEQATGGTITDAQLDKFLLTDDVKGAAATYIDTNITDKGKAETALNNLGYTGTSGEIESLVGRTEDDADPEDIVDDPDQVTIDEARASFQDTYGYTPTDDELAMFVGQRDQESTYDELGRYVDLHQVTLAEARASFQDTYGYTPTDDELNQFVGQRDQESTYTDIGEYVNPRQVTSDEARASFQDTYGYTPTDEELAMFVGQRDQESTYTDIGEYVNPRQVTLAEATAQFKDTYGYNPTDDELNQFVGQRDQESTYTDIGEYVDPRQVTSDEFADYAKDENFFYDPSDEDFLNQYVGQRDEAETADLFRTYADPLATTNQEALDIYKQQYADLYGVDAADVSDDMVAQFMADTGNTAETEYTGGVQDQLSKDLGFDDYTDRTYAAESMGEQRPDSGMWEDFQTTSGVVGMEGSGIAPMQFAETDQAAEFLPEVPTPEPETDIASVDQTNEQTAEQLETQPDFAQTLAGMIRQEQAQPTDYGPGVQVAAAPVMESPVTSDAGADMLQSIGLGSAPEQPETAPSQGIASLLSTEPEARMDNPTSLSTTEGNSVYNALTGADTTGTIAERVLESDPDAIQTGGIYSGAKSEVAAGDTLTQKYLGGTPEGQQELEGLGLTGVSGTAPPSRTDEALRTTDGDSSQESSLLIPEPLGRTTLPTGQSAKNIGALNMDEDYFEAGSQEDADMGQSMRELENMGGVDENFLTNLSPADHARYLAMQGEGYKAPEYGVQDMGISQQNIDSFNENFNPVGGFTSQWQTVGSDRIMINDDGTAIGMNENGDSYALSPKEVQQMIQQGLLNTGASGYVAATGGTGNRPGGSGGSGSSKPPGFNFDKLADKLLTPKVGAVLAGAALGALGRPKGINPMGLKSLGASPGAQRVQTGAKGTGGKGSVRYFEKRAEGGAINGYARGGGLGYLKGADDGMADRINATIDNKRPAKLSGGEFVIPADVVSHLGNGNSDAGAKQLYALMERVRKARTGNDKQGKQINPKKYLPK
jgi:hypothetical protein